MTQSAFQHVAHWVFDLDNTLYPRTCRLFDQIDILITDYVIRLTGLERSEARALQKQYVRTHGTTLNGLMAHHEVDPHDYLIKVHDIDYSPVIPNPELVAKIDALRGDKYIYTNGSEDHAQSVLKRLGAQHSFKGVFAIADAAFVPKPALGGYTAFLDKFDIDPAQSAMFEDMHINLKTAHQLGIRTIHVVPPQHFEGDGLDGHELARADGADHIHFVTDDLTGFLAQLGA